jgi:hypothetical protein
MIDVDLAELYQPPIIREQRDKLKHIGHSSADYPRPQIVKSCRRNSAAADGGDDRNLRSNRDATCQSTCEANVVVPDEDIDVLPNFSLLRGNSIAQARVEYPQR